MTKEQRLEAIMDILDKNGTVRNSDLMEKFQVSDMTVRRDLDTLIEQNKIIRVHGGAVPAAAQGTNQPEVPAPATLPSAPSAAEGASKSAPAMDLEPAYLKRLRENPTAKQEISALAIEQIPQRSFVFLDSGSSTYYIAKNMPQQQSSCIYITNGINIASELLTRGFPHILYIGGEVDLNIWATRGAFAENQIRNFHADVAFLGCNAISPEGDVMIGNPTEYGLKRAIMDISNRRYLVVDASKFDTYSLTTYANVRDFDGIITDSALPMSIREAITGCGGKLITPRSSEAAK